MSDFENASENQLLSALPLDVCEQLLTSSKEIYLTSGQIIHKYNEEILDVYFPLTAVISSVMKMSNGSSSEVALIGREGLVGLPAIFGSTLSTSNSVVQISGTAISISIQALKTEFQKGEELQQLLLLYTQAYIAQISHIAACNSLHSVEQRFARFLLLVSHCADCEIFYLTQKLISLLLGVRRASITETAISLQSRNIIKYSRGKIEIVDRSKLEAIACECYGKIQSDYFGFLR